MEALELELKRMNVMIHAPRCPMSPLKCIVGENFGLLAECAKKGELLQSV